METKEAVRDRIQSIIRSHLGVEADQVVDTANLHELGADSLDDIEIIMALEQEFSIEISDDDASGLTTVGALIAHVEKAVG